MSTNNQCVLCLGHSIEEFPNIKLKGVTSDCKPWPDTGRFCICRDCGHVQKQMSADWLKDVANIYSSYNSYPLSDAKDQLLHDSGTPQSRNKQLLGEISKEIDLKDSGKILDLGCGKGQFLRCFSEIYKKWDLYGCDQQESLRPEITSIPKVKDYYTGPLEKVSAKFDFISMLYVIEHLFNPLEILYTIKGKLSDGGIVFIQTGNLATNPFELTIVDHSSIFTLETLEQLTRKAGFEILASSDSWRDKEIGILARISNRMKVTTELINYFHLNKVLLNKQNSWLLSFIHEIDATIPKENIGILGSTIAGTWLANYPQCKFSFWIDEDLSKVGKKHMGAEIIRIENAPEKAFVYLPFPNLIARKIYIRLKKIRPDINFLFLHNERL
ncbi:class I SAM-dependent methyltransferase [Desulfovibrio gilichinskyi]|uniref:2-polyprenyl-3-methyl-5-hydroxy-6-metoxy-1,4-benzoquinol methylase n=1 Tax=Desulfovibrio gilichinskyi TaxID=1519643 RepID=A0A1X7F474_9BACT|nr:class I SAM-dependent methyltransferase [Desulfovibrio gilichinskyi]SMF45108.1 2-polyprenyl-3-methyl-5-hydroxy-6-metoxy-1,4-benzoquinol methylase [Desulfovibrio gilichinskyi]